MASLEWRAPEYDYRKKDVSWYWISIIIAVLMLGFAAWEKNFPFGFFIVVAEIMILVWANTEPPILHFELGDKGVSIGEHKFHQYTEFVNWSVDEETAGDFVNLFFQFHRPRPKLKVRLPREIVNDARLALKKFLPEVKHEHSLVDSIEELIGF